MINNKINHIENYKKSFLTLSLSILFAFAISNLLALNFNVLISSTTILIPIYLLIFSLFYLSIKLNYIYSIFFITSLIVLIGFFENIYLILFYFFLGLFSLIYLLKNGFFSINRRDLYLLLISSILTSIALIGDNFAQVRIDVSEYIVSGLIHPDILFHASISAMIKNYGVISNGINGLIYLPYHFLSHGLVAGFSKFSNTSVIETYGSIQSLLINPLLIYIITISSFNLIQSKKNDFFLRWNITLILLYLTPQFLHQFAFWNSYFNSLSYSLSLVLIIASFSSINKLRFNNGLLFTNYQLIMISLAKGSAGVLFLIIILFKNLKSKLSKNKILFISLFFITSFFLVSLLIGSDAKKSIKLGYFNFADDFFLSKLEFIKYSEINQYLSKIILLILFYIFHFIFPFFLFLFYIFKLKKQKNINYLEHIRIIFILTVACILIISFFDIPGGAVYYFSNIPNILALPILIVLFSDLFDKTIKNKQFFLIVLAIFLYFAHIPIAQQTKYYKSSIELKKNDLVEYLLEMRINNDDLNNNFYRIESDITKNNPIINCKFKPFLYPAISEKKWINLINDQNCNYQNYGYDTHFLDKENKLIKLPIK